MISSPLAKCCIAAMLIFAMQASAFMHPAAFPATTFASRALSHDHDVSCHATNKRENCPGKTAFNSSNSVGGIGGLNINKANKKIQRPAPTNNKAKKVATPAPKPKAKKAIAKSNNKSQKSTKSVGVGGAPKADIDWGTVILAFLTPWRNPNSIFLYLLIIVSVLGKLNEVPQ